MHCDREREIQSHTEIDRDRERERQRKGEIDRLTDRHINGSNLLKSHIFIFYKESKREKSKEINR